jgi:hypothetical protein
VNYGERYREYLEQLVEIINRFEDYMTVDGLKQHIAYLQAVDALRLGPVPLEGEATMFDCNDSAFPEHQCIDKNGNEMGLGLTKFEQCAMDFTAAWVQSCSQDRTTPDNEAIQEAVRIGILAAEAFCTAMEEREK